jgi:hypothetical protein
MALAPFLDCAEHYPQWVSLGSHSIWTSHIPWFWSLTGFACCSIVLVLQDNAIFPC